MKITTLNNGLTIISKQNPYSNFATIAYSVKAGSYQEKGFPNGTAHFVEHMLSKGTINRTNIQINEEMTFLGAEFNAFTTYEETKYHCDVPHELWKKGLDILNEVFWYPTLPLEELDKERNVILEEINSYNDEPDSFIMDTLIKKIYSNNREMQSIIGSTRSVKSVEREHLLDFVNKYYNSDNVYLVATGNINHDLLVEYMSNYKISRTTKQNFKKTIFKPNKLNVQKFTYKKDLSQAYYSFGLHAPSSRDTDCYVMDAISYLLAGDMSSRLYKIIREEKGLVYGISLDIEANMDTGLFMGCVSLEEKNLEEVKYIISEQMSLLTLQGIGNHELERVKNGMIASFLRGYEDRMSINDYISSCYINDVSPNEQNYISSIQSITSEDIQKVSKKYFKEDNFLSIEVTPNNN